MEVLIIGASGFLGSRLRKHLENTEGLNIHCPSHKEVDALSFNEVRSYILDYGIEVVYHIAANHAGIGSGVNKELFFLETNLIMNYNLVKASYENGVKKFITLGTSCCYNDSDKEIFCENDYWSNKSEITYGTCKRVMLEHLLNQNKMNWVYFIPPNLYGPDDHFNDKHAHFISATIQKFNDAILTKSNKVVVWGDGKQERDFLYVDDMVEILEESIFSSKYDSKILNISTGIDSSVKEAVDLIKKYYGNESIEIKWDLSKPTGVKKKSISNRKFLNISPDFKFTCLEEGIRRTVKWYLENMN